MQKNKGFSVIVIIIILAVLVIGSYVVWKNQAASTPAPAILDNSFTAAPAPGSSTSPSTPSVDMTGSGMPRISNIAPSSGFPGTVVTLSGNGFTSGSATYVGISESGQKSFDPNSVSSTKLTFTIPNDLTPGNHDITVFVTARQTPTSNKVTFTVFNPTNNQQ
ncbi:MAG: IPT/TIG domain-containing protein [Patescibacteria group bacterium]